MLLDTEEVAPGVTKVNLRGRLDAAGARAIEGPFTTLARTQYDMLVDLSRVTFIASMGLRVMIATCRTLAEHGGRMGFLRPDTAVEAVLISSGTDTMIPVFQDLGEAIRGVCGTGMDDVAGVTATRTLAIHLLRTPQGAAQAGRWVDELAGTLSLSERTEFALRLCLEEAVGLITSGTGPAVEGDDGTILLRLVAEPALLCVTIQDRGPPIDPFRRDSNSGEREPLGGGSFGIGLMRQYAREVSWSRLGETNRLTLIVAR
jgi:anti-anti-sigma factor